MDNISKTPISCKSFRHLAFTLAEVLITLTVIGILAAETIPVLMTNVQESQFRSHLKKTYAGLSMAVLQMNVLGTKYWTPTNTTATTNDTDMKNEFMQYMKVTKDGKVSSIVPSDFYATYGTAYKSSTTNVGIANYHRAYLAMDGHIAVFDWLYNGIRKDNNGQYIYGQVTIDLNGIKGPNMMGKDIEHFLIIGDSPSLLQIKASGYPGSSSTFGGQGCEAGGSIYKSYGCTYLMLYDKEMP